MPGQAPDEIPNFLNDEAIHCHILYKQNVFVDAVLITAGTRSAIVDGAKRPISPVHSGTPASSLHYIGWLARRP